MISLLDRLPWRPGRLGTGYRKLRLAGGSWWDAYLLDYPPGSSAPVHVDPLPGHRHVRASFRLYGEDTLSPSSFWREVERRDGIWEFALLRVGRFVVFRPDLIDHEVLPSARRRVVLSVGFAL